MGSADAEHAKGIAQVRTILGFLIAPGVPALGHHAFNVMFRPLQLAEMFSIILAMIGYIAALVFGIPIYL